MCGITGWVAYRRDLRGEQAAVDAMTATMACRGPDDRGTWIDEHAALGHHRLAVIDVEGGRQPMSADPGGGTDDAVAMVYSGEAYNFVELREELRGRGHRFETDSDTEVVLRGYLEWGAAVAERLNGMYAFAIWDSRERKLVMIRDRMGIKPFYYYPTEDGVLFGSEPKAILANPLAERTVTLEGLRELFAFIKPPGSAFWEGMREVRPGTVVTVDAGGVRETVYWSLRTQEHHDSREDTVAHVRELLDDIVRRQLVADVPRCTLLSGGLDSSAMTAIAARQLEQAGETVRSFAVDFVGRTQNFVPDEIRETPDAPFVHDVAEKSKTEHRDIIVSSADLADPDLRAAVVRARDMPAGYGDVDTSLYLLFKSIREHSTVALSGESADEVFGGYKWFFDPLVHELPTFPWLVQYIMTAGDTKPILRQPVLDAMDLSTYITDRYNTAIAEVDRLDGESDFEYTMRKISYLHLTQYLQLLLDRKDRMSMAVGLEVRVPFCDHRLVEYVYNAPWEQKTYDGKEKSLLRGASLDLLPASVAERVKSPYPSTQDPSYAQALQVQCKDLLADPSHPVFELIDKDVLCASATADSPQITEGSRRGMERALDMAVWLDIYSPNIKVA
ncbi:asparagine synthase (glutamine-hydrolyzing) [Actinomadura sp. WAC 06369]|uniref:asparagine synthase (glutamine-hydrolyzing) n=1 Tax=Actinomadura sp. WAC 06369 TaxID=2203193 RepID=UPI000F7888BC|nr:asparagine synthase (glutamine-hydrolyzing) [Actinomadura sp. WAC 06369]RSN69756.1 asparagine synthase (glutamine-hydrolyzing) [Actinomadura sp. WAC 06369]